MNDPHHAAAISRRHWLKLAGLGTLGAAGGLFADARVAHASDYKAIVCVFLYGGNDGMNMIVPSDSATYAKYSAVRGNVAIPRSALEPLGSSGYGLHPSMSALAPAWSAGELAPVFNVGPLYAPLSKAQFRAAKDNSDLIPDSLYSHSDQSAHWETSTTDSFVRIGWGGRAAEVMAMKNPVIALGGSGLFGVSALDAPLELPGPGSSFGAIELGKDSWRTSYAPLVARAKALRAMHAASPGYDLGAAYAKQQAQAFAVSDRLASIVKTQPGDANANTAISTGFAKIIAGGQVTTDLGRQLYQVAKLIAGRASVGGSRQIFFVQQGGYDTHSDQVGSNPTAGKHADLLKELGDALGAFHSAMTHLGLADSVTAFTQSEFGRTFKPNSSRGTDHAWGNQHLVIGGAVKGGTYGSYPLLELGSANDVGVDSWELQGRWIPTTSVDQYAATLLGWLGANDAQLDLILPNLAHFGSKRKLGFL